MTRRGYAIVLMQFLVAGGLLAGAELLWERGAVWAGLLALWLTGTALLMLFWIAAVLCDVAKRWARRQRVRRQEWWRV